MQTGCKVKLTYVRSIFLTSSFEVFWEPQAKWLGGTKWSPALLEKLRIERDFHWFKNIKYNIRLTPDRYHQLSTRLHFDYGYNSFCPFVLICFDNLCMTILRYSKTIFPRSIHFHSFWCWFLNFISYIYIGYYYFYFTNKTL